MRYSLAQAVLMGMIHPMVSPLKVVANPRAGRWDVILLSCHRLPLFVCWLSDNFFCNFAHFVVVFAKTKVQHLRKPALSTLIIIIIVEH